jgi:hypothetical protein
MAAYETQDPNSLDQVQNQPGFDDQSDDQSNYGGGDQSNSVGGGGGNQDQLSYAAAGQDQGPVDQSSFAAGGQDQGQLDQSSFAGGQDQSGGDGMGTIDQSGGYSDPSQPAAAADAPDSSSGGFGTTAAGINDQSGSSPTVSRSFFNGFSSSLHNYASEMAWEKRRGLQFSKCGSLHGLKPTPTKKKKNSTTSVFYRLMIQLLRRPALATKPATRSTTAWKIF